MDKLYSIPATVTLGGESFNVCVFAIDDQGRMWGLKEEMLPDKYTDCSNLYALIDKLKSEER